MSVLSLGVAAATCGMLVADQHLDRQDKDKDNKNQNQNQHQQDRARAGEQSKEGRIVHLLDYLRATNSPSEHTQAQSQAQYNRLDRPGRPIRGAHLNQAEQQTYRGAGQEGPLALIVSGSSGTKAITSSSESSPRKSEADRASGQKNERLDESKSSPSHAGGETVYLLVFDAQNPQSSMTEQKARQLAARGSRTAQPRSETDRVQTGEPATRTEQDRQTARFKVEGESNESDETVVQVRDRVEREGSTSDSGKRGAVSVSGKIVEKSGIQVIVVSAIEEAGSQADSKHKKNQPDQKKNANDGNDGQDDRDESKSKNKPEDR